MSNLQKATLGNGCFWCTEAIFKQLKGVISTKSGYSGGQVVNPSYKAVCSGATGHAEVLQIVFDADIITFPELLDVFWKTHDPTTLNRQGNDIGTQYRSVIFYHNGDQKSQAENSKTALESSKVWNDPIVTEISAFDKFYPSEDYHDNYFDSHGHEPYCSLVVAPKVAKFKKEFGDRIG